MDDWKHSDQVTFFAGVAELLLAAITIFQLIRIIVSSLETGLKLAAKKVFHALIAVVLLVRGPFLVLFPFHLFRIEVVIIWNHGAEVLFALAYLMLLMFWADFYLHMAHGRDVNFFQKAKKPLITFFAIMAILFLLYMILFFFETTNSERDMLDSAGSIVVNVLILGVALGFLFFGFKLYVLLDSFGVPSKHAAMRANKIGLVAAAITLCFLGRAAVGIWSIINVPSQEEGKKADWDIPWYWIGLLFFGTEILPTMLILFLLRNLPKEGDVESKRKPQLTTYSTLSATVQR